jgi:hypothetical protein
LYAHLLFFFDSITVFSCIPGVVADFLCELSVEWLPQDITKHINTVKGRVIDLI